MSEMPGNGVEGDSFEGLLEQEAYKKLKTCPKLTEDDEGFNDINNVLNELDNICKIVDTNAENHSNDPYKQIEYIFGYIYGGFFTVDRLKNLELSPIYINRGLDSNFTLTPESILEKLIEGFTTSYNRGLAGKWKLKDYTFSLVIERINLEKMKNTDIKKYIIAIFNDRGEQIKIVIHDDRFSKN